MGAMDARNRLVTAALALIEHGEGAFSTRAACEAAGVTAPTLYHHFSDADGLVSAAIELGFEQFHARKLALRPPADATRALLAGWDDYVDFAAERPRLYAAMTARILQGARIPAAARSREHLLVRLAALDAAGRLALPVAAAADVVWSSAHAAALLTVAAHPKMPRPAAIKALRQTARSVLKPRKKESSV
jgi:AcrR family transcriptional regulator